MKQLWSAKGWEPNRARSPSLPRSSFITMSLAPADAVLRARDASAEASSEADAVLRARDTSAVDWESQTSSWERPFNPRPTVVAPQRQPPGVLVEAVRMLHLMTTTIARQQRLSRMDSLRTAPLQPISWCGCRQPFLQSIRCTLKPLSRLTGSAMTTPKPHAPSADSAAGAAGAAMAAAHHVADGSDP